jgi:hypothetical protein
MPLVWAAVQARLAENATSFAALNVLDGTVIGQCMARHRHQEFIRIEDQAALRVGAALRNFEAMEHVAR